MTRPHELAPVGMPLMCSAFGDDQDRTPLTRIRCRRRLPILLRSRSVAVANYRRTRRVGWPRCAVRGADIHLALRHPAARWPGTPITLRQGARVIEDSRRLRLAWSDKGQGGR